MSGCDLRSRTDHFWVWRAAPPQPFAARESDSETGLFYYRAKRYDPSTLFSSPVAYNPAITSISTSASFGRRDTCTVERAGGANVKNLPYTSFMAANSFMSFRNTVVFTT